MIGLSAILSVSPDSYLREKEEYCSKCGEHPREFGDVCAFCLEEILEKKEELK